MSPKSPASPRKKRIRPPRGSGLRSRTGCVTCRTRHRKCDEARPCCDNCVKAGRECDWQPPDVDIDQLIATQQMGERHSSSYTAGSIPPGSLSEIIQLNGIETAAENNDVTITCRSISSPEATQLGISPGSTEPSTSSMIDHAPNRWLNLLVQDIERAGIELETPAAIDSSGGISLLRTSWDLDTDVGHTGSQRHETPHQAASMGRWVAQNPPQDVVLTREEMQIFQNFVARSARWLDIFDAEEHFAGHVSRLALRDEGLMNAVLALSAHHLFREECMKQPATTTSSDLAVRFYYKTLCYVQQAMQYAAYAQSEELLATALIVSTYEMLDESTEGWYRHLKGVYWIQRSQNVNGNSPGIRRAVWWAWLRQEQWAAFREKRKSTSYWVPPAPIAEQTQDQLASYIYILLRSAIDFAARRDSEAIMDLQFLARRVQTAEDLLQELLAWKDSTGPPFEPLLYDENGLNKDVSSSVRTVFKPIWIHPPKFAVAMQTFHFARLLIHLNRPVLEGLGANSESRKALHESVSTICGIAMTLEDDACQIISSQCLYGAGLCEHADVRQAAILELLRRCELRSGWPTSQLRSDLQSHWIDK